MKNVVAAFAALLAFAFAPFAFAASLEDALQAAAAGKSATVGVAVYGIEDGSLAQINGNGHFPMQSVFKFHIALAVLHKVDKGELRLEQELLITKADLLEDTWSPIRKKHPKGNVKLPLSEVLRYTVAESDNNGCDILLRLIGGPDVVEAYIRGLGIEDVAIRHNEEEMHTAWDIQFGNWTTPAAAVKLLAAFDKKEPLSEASSAFLWKVMTETSTGSRRLKCLLPPDTVVAHKTGSSDTNALGVTAAVNDIGIIILPDGRRIAIAVFVSDSRESTAVNEGIIAEMGKLVYDHFTKAR